MSRPIVRSDRAEEDLIAIWFHVASDSQAAADRLLDRIEERSWQLATHPHLGAARDDVSPGMRVLLAGKYLIFYRVSDRDIKLVRILHGSRDITADDFEP